MRLGECITGRRRARTVPMHVVDRAMTEPR
jgi:hypothetical protein